MMKEMMNNNKRRFFILLVAAMVLCTGCNKFIAKTTDTVINIGLYDDINGFDVAGTKGILSENIGRCVYSTLFTFDENLEIVPQLVKSYEHVSEKEWIFNIIEDVKFHDGSALTANDVKFSIDRAKNHKDKDSSLDVIENIEVLNDLTLKVTTALPNVDLLSTFVRISTSVMSEKAMQNPEYDTNKPVGSGPFKVLEYRKNEIISLECFDEYFLDQAKTKYLNFVIDTSESNLTASLLNNKLDIVFRVSSYDCASLKLNSNIKIYENNSSKMEILVLNPAHKPLDNLKVRQAINYAIDKNALVDKVQDGYAVPLYSVLPTTIMGSINVEDQAYNPELSRELLKEAGFENGFEISLISYDELRKKQMEYIKLDLAQVGITLNYEILLLDDYVDALKENKNQISVLSWTCNSDPDSVFSQLYSKSGPPTLNHARFSEPKVEELILQGRQEAELEKRQYIYEEANRLIVETSTFVPLYQPIILVAASKNIDGLQMNPQGLFRYETLYKAK